jgi:hypothetical protein
MALPKRNSISTGKSVLKLATGQLYVAAALPLTSKRRCVEIEHDSHFREGKAIRRAGIP